MTTPRDETLAELAVAITDPDHPTKTETSAWARANLCGHDLVDADARSAFAADDWRRCAERRIFGMLVPTELGGTGSGLATALLTLEGLGHGCRDRGLPYAVASQVLTTEVALARFGTPAQRERWLPGLLAGTVVGAFAITEPEAGSDPFALSTRAELRPDGSFVISGHKSYITFAPICDVCIVFASTRPEAGSWGLTAFLVDTSAPGVTRGELRPKMGMRTAPFGDLDFDEVVVGPDDVLGREGSGASIFRAILDIERSYVFAPQVGAMERELAEAVAFANAREQGGQPIGRHQAVAHRLVAMKERHERARLFLYRAAMAEAVGRDVTMYASLAKIVAADTGIASALDSVTIHGARGYVTDHEVERSLRDSVGGLSYSGATDVLRNVVARMLGVG